MLRISDLEKKIENLPLLPAIVVRLLALDANDENCFEQVLELLQEDPALALKIIRVSNSAASHPVNPIINLYDAIVRLGVKSVASLITSMSTIRVFVPTTQEERNLWVHSIQVAVGARFIARTATALEVDPEQTYLCGLLHDIGRFVLFDEAVDELRLVEGASWESPAQLVDLEREQYGFNHSELGSRVCDKWGIPQTIIEVVAEHHTYDLPGKSPQDQISNNLIRIVQLADFFSVFMILNPDSILLEPDLFEKELNDKCVHPSTSNPPLSAKQLHVLASSIIEESTALMSGLV